MWVWFALRCQLRIRSTSRLGSNPYSVNSTRNTGSSCRASSRAVQRRHPSRRLAGRSRTGTLRRGRLVEVFAEGVGLLLVVAADSFAVEGRRRLDHSFEGELTDSLAVFDH